MKMIDIYADAETAGSLHSPARSTVEPRPATWAGFGGACRLFPGRVDEEPRLDQ